MQRDPILIGESVVTAAFKPMLGKPSWLVRQGHGSFLTLEFGDPVLTVRAPRERRVLLGDSVPPRLLCRETSVGGTWHLWIYCCEWSLSYEDAELAMSESDDTTIARALGVLDGQALAQVELDVDDGSTRFTFDLGGTLFTRPAPHGVYHDPVVQWMLFQPSGRVLSVRADGMYADQSGDTRRDDEMWSPLSGRPNV